MELILIAAIIIFFVIRGKKQKKKNESENKEKEFVISKAQDCTDIELPKDYFIIQFMDWMNENVTDEKKISTYYELKEVNHDFVGLDKFLKGFETVNSLCQKELPPIFFNSQEDWQKLMKGRTVDEVENYITDSTVRVLPIIAGLTRQCSNNYLTLAMGYTKDVILSFDDVLPLAHKSYDFAKETKWKEICISHPQYSKYRELFFEHANKESAKAKWINFYMKARLKVMEDFGAVDWIGRFTDCVKKMEQENMDLFCIISMSRKLSKYSSFYEITDYSSENVERIVKLYKQGIIKGVYKKEKDPKYKEVQRK